MLVIKLGIYKQFLTTIIVSGIIVYFLNFTLLIIIHELGHAVSCILFGWEIVQIDLNLFSLNELENGGIIVYCCPIIIPEYQKLSMLISGSLMTSVIGLILSLISVRLKKKRVLSYSLLLLGVCFSFDFFRYFIADVLVLKEGDWFKILNINLDAGILFLFIGGLIAIASFSCSIPILKSITEIVVEETKYDENISRISETLKIDILETSIEDIKECFEIYVRDLFLIKDCSFLQF